MPRISAPIAAPVGMISMDMGRSSAGSRRALQRVSGYNPREPIRFLSINEQRPSLIPDDIHAYDGVAPPLAASGYRVIVPYLCGDGPTRFRDPATPRSGQQVALGPRSP